VADATIGFSVRLPAGASGTVTVAQGRDQGSSVTRWILYYDATAQGFWYYAFNGAGTSTGIFTGSGSALRGGWIGVRLRYTGTSAGGAQIWIDNATRPEWSVSGDYSNTTPFQRLQLWSDVAGDVDMDDISVSAGSGTFTVGAASNSEDTSGVALIGSMVSFAGLFVLMMRGRSRRTGVSLRPAPS